MTITAAGVPQITAPVTSVAPVALVLPVAPVAPVTPVAPGAPAARPRRRWLYALLALVPIAAVAGFLGYRWTHPATVPFRTLRVVRADITERVTATGTLQPTITSPVGAQVSGIVWKLHADYNSTVKAGQLLVELDPALFNNAVALATAQLAQATANLRSTQAAARGARVIHTRTLKLARDKLVSRSDLDAASATWDSTNALARSSVAQIAQARAQLNRATLDLQHSIIRSPVDGTVISRNVDVGQAVAATLTAPTLFTIAQDLRHMQVHAAVDEADIGEVRPGQGATFTVDAFRGESFAAKVNAVRNAPQTAQSVVTYDVVLDVDNHDQKLRPGMTANVLILIVQKSQVIAVPNEALRFRPVAAAARTATSTLKASSADAKSGAAVYVVQAGGAVRVAIKTGITDGNMTEVEGLEPGREVIIDVTRAKGKAPAATGAGRGP